MKNNEDWFNVLNICRDKMAKSCKLQKGFELLMNANTTEQEEEMSNGAKKNRGPEIVERVVCGPPSIGNQNPWY